MGNSPMSKDKHWLVFDCETDSFDGLPVTPFIWGWMRDNGNYDFTYSTSEFVEILKDFDGIALAHNGGKFDTVLLADHFNIDSNIKIINGRVAEVKIGKATVRDSFLIIPSPLAASGKKDDFDYSILDRRNKKLRKKYKAEIEKYLKQDCRALWELVGRFYSVHGQRLTQAGAALKQWESMTQLHRRWGGAHDQFFRQFYFGGRCEAFQKGALGDGWDYLDVKSSYPFAMSHQHTASHISDYEISNKLSSITPQSFARIIAASHGCLPARDKYSTAFSHHDDPREYFATGWEILAGLETNTLKVFECTVFTPNKLETLKPYVDKFYQDKLDAERAGDSVGRLIAKIFMNSLYGKFGQNSADFKRYKIVDCGVELDNYSTFLEADNFDIIQAPSGGQFFDVALSASICGFARAYLFRQMLKVDDLAYSDTDSIICKGGNFDLGENVGQWEHVHTLDRFHVAGKKLYSGYDSRRGEWVTAHKGFSKLDTTHDNIISAANGGILEIKRSAPSIDVVGKQRFINRTMKAT
jgi:hypothetical protein